MARRAPRLKRGDFYMVDVGDDADGTPSKRDALTRAREFACGRGVYHGSGAHYRKPVVVTLSTARGNSPVFACEPVRGKKACRCVRGAAAVRRMSKRNGFRVLG